MRAGQGGEGQSEVAQRSGANENNDGQLWKLWVPFRKQVLDLESGKYLACPPNLCNTAINKSLTEFSSRAKIANSRMTY